MRNIFYAGLVSSFVLLQGCGGDDGSPLPGIPESNGPIFGVSTTNVTISGKQFADPEAPFRINFIYSRNDISRVNVPHRFLNPDIFDGDIFRASMDTSHTFVDISSANWDVEGGTYSDEMIVTPVLQSGQDGTPVTIRLTLVQEATTPITMTPEFVNNIQVVEGGPPVRTKVTINAGNTINWQVEPYYYQAEEIMAVTSDPDTGTGSQEIDIVVTPTPLLVQEIKEQAGTGFFQVGFIDLDAPGNFVTLDLDVTLVE